MRMSPVFQHSSGRRRISGISFGIAGGTFLEDVTGFIQVMSRHCSQAREWKIVLIVNPALEQSEMPGHSSGCPDMQKESPEGSFFLAFILMSVY